MRSLQASLSSSWLPGSSLSLVLLPFTVEELGRVEELSFLYLAQVLYLLQGPGLPPCTSLTRPLGRRSNLPSSETLNLVCKNKVG